MRTRVGAALLLAFPLAVTGSPAERLTLDEAQAIALANHPAIRSQTLQALATHENVKEARSALFPTVTGLISGVGADNGSRVAAGAVNNPVIYSRMGTGFAISQTLFDFGRTQRNVDSVRFAAQAQDQQVEATRADILLAVQRAYFEALRAQSLLSVATATVAARQTIVDQVRELVKAQIKSSLDLSFAETSLAEAKLLVSSTENQRRASLVILSETLGRPAIDDIELVDRTEVKLEPRALSELQRKALRSRPELRAVALEVESANSEAAAERASKFPVLAVAAGAGYVPFGSARLGTNYSVVGVNVSIPVFNGGLYAARETRAILRSQATEQRRIELANRILRDVSRAWLDTNTAYERIQLTQQFVQQATQALDLAQTRYDLGLSSIVEYSQAQLAKTNAQIQYSAARYEYQILRAELAFQSGGM